MTMPLPSSHRLWPLSGVGFEHLGPMLEAPLPAHGPDELLVRHDATGICFSDVKVIRAGQDHPRIHRDIRQAPVVLGHEVSLTVVGVGATIRDRFAPGDRFMVQADIVADGVGQAYGYELPGGFSQFGVIDRRVYDDYLVPVSPATGYAEAALAEPWACIEASYTVSYRDAWRAGGTVWLTGNGAGVELGRAETWRPARIVIDVADAGFAGRVRTWARANTVDIVEEHADGYDDVVALSNDAAVIEAAFARLRPGGVFAIVSAEAVAPPVGLDVGRLHYDHIAVVGAGGTVIGDAYEPIRSHLRPDGRLWVLGAGGPMGHMHLQRALGIAERPRAIVATSRARHRVDAIAAKFSGAADTAGVALVCGDDSQASGRFDDVVVTAPSAPAIERAASHLADGGVMNLFAGVPRGSIAHIDADGIVRRGVRFTGTSGSSTADLARVRDLIEGGHLAPNQAIAAIGGLDAVPAGLAAVEQGRFSGKVVIFPQLSLPLTTLPALAQRLPSVHALLSAHGHWTVAAETELLRLLGPVH